MKNLTFLLTNPQFSNLVPVRDFLQYWSRKLPLIHRFQKEWLPFQSSAVAHPFKALPAPASPEASEAEGQAWERQPPPLTNLPQEISESPFWINALLQQMDQAIVTVDLQGEITFINFVAEEWLGFPAAKVLHRNFSELFTFVHEKTRLMIRSPAMRAMRQRMTVTLDRQTVFVPSTGKERHIEGSAAPIFDRNGQVSGGVLLFRDITLVKRQQNMMQNLPGMAYRSRFDARRTLEFVSEGCLEITGYTPFDLLQNRKIAYGDLIQEEDRELVWSELQALVQNGDSFRLTYQLCNAQGETQWVWEYGRVIRTADGYIQALEGFITCV